MRATIASLGRVRMIPPNGVRHTGLLGSRLAVGELEQKIVAVKSELQASILTTRNELQESIHRVEANVHRIEAKMSRWMITMLVTMAALITLFNYFLD